jgi:hypothetical protein
MHLEGLVLAVRIDRCNNRGWDLAEVLRHTVCHSEHLDVARRALVREAGQLPDELQAQRRHDLLGQPPGEAARLGVKHDAGARFRSYGDLGGDEGHRRRARPDPCGTAVPKLGTIRRSDARRRRHAPRHGSHAYPGWTEGREVGQWPSAENRLSTPTSQLWKATLLNRSENGQLHLTSRPQPPEFRRSSPHTSEASTPNWDARDPASESITSPHHV